MSVVHGEACRITPQLTVAGHCHDRILLAPRTPSPVKVIVIKVTVVDIALRHDIGLIHN